jgi:hypothetical protein
MTRSFSFLAVAAVVLGLTAAPALAGGKLDASIALSGSSTLAAASSTQPAVSGAASFNVHRSYAYNKDTIWVVNRCWDASGTEVVGEASAVIWGTWENLDGYTGAMATGGTRCTAYVMVKGQQVGAATSYTVS